MIFCVDLSIFGWSAVQIINGFLSVLKQVDHIFVPLIVDDQIFTAFVIDGFDVESCLEQLFLGVHLYYQSIMIYLMIYH
jgi:hypothetical protein